MSEKIPEESEQKKSGIYSEGTQVIGRAGSIYFGVKGEVIAFIDDPGHLGYKKYRIRVTDDSQRQEFGDIIFVDMEELGALDSVRIERLDNISHGTRIKTRSNEMGVVTDEKDERFPDSTIIVLMDDGSKRRGSSSAEVEIIN